VPASSIQHQQHDLVGTGSHFLGKGGQHLTKDIDAHARQQPPTGGPGLRLDKAIEVEPLIPMLHDGDWLAASPHPHPTPDRFEADPMLVKGPQLH